MTSYFVTSRLAMGAAVLVIIGCTGCGGSGSRGASLAQVTSHTTSNGGKVSTQTSSPQTSISATPQTSASVSKGSGGPPGQPTAVPDACALLTLSRAQRVSPGVEREPHEEGTTECDYKPPEPNQDEADVALTINSSVLPARYKESLVLAKKSPIFETLRGLGEGAACFGAVVPGARPPDVANIISAEFKRGSTTFLVITETASTKPTCTGAVSLAREINALLPSDEAAYAARRAPESTAPPASAITAQAGPCYLSRASASAVTQVPMIPEGHREEGGTSACAYGSADKEMLLNLSTGSGLIAGNEPEANPCTASQPSPDVVVSIAGGCLIKSHESHDPGGYLMSVAITGKPAVTLQYQGPASQGMSPVAQRLEIAALAVGRELVGE